MASRSDHYRLSRAFPGLIRDFARFEQDERTYNLAKALTQGASGDAADAIWAAAAQTIRIRK